MYRVKLPVIKYVLIIEHFQIISSSLNQIEQFLQFLCHWTRKQEGNECSFSVRSERAMQKTQEEDE